MHQQLQLQIAEPCHENWNQMTAQTQGRFCGSCQKTVFDFTTMTDNQLLEYFKNYKSDTCGRFENHQLDRVLATPPPAKPSWYKWGFAMLFSGFLFTSKAKAQGMVMVLEKSNKQPVPKEKIKSSKLEPENSYELKGKIVDETGTGIPYASVKVLGGNWGVSCDSLGNFILISKGSSRNRLLSFSSIGFSAQAKLISFDEYKKGDLVIALETASQGLSEVVVTGFADKKLSGRVGGMAVYTKVSRQVPLLKRIFGDNPIVKLFPNPAVVGSAVTLQFVKAGDFSLRLIDVQGKMLLAQSGIHLPEKQSYSLQIPSNAVAGEYFLQIIDANGKTLATEKLLIVH